MKMQRSVNVRRTRVRLLRLDPIENSWQRRGAAFAETHGRSYAYETAAHLEIEPMLEKAMPFIEPRGGNGSTDAHITACWVSGGGVFRIFK